MCLPSQDQLFLEKYLVGLQVNLADMGTQVGGLKTLNKKIRSLFLTHYYQLLSANKGRLKMTGADEHGANQVFYEVIYLLCTHNCGQTTRI